MNRLVDLVDELVTGNTDLRIRIDALTVDPGPLALASQPMTTIDEDEMSRSQSSSPFEMDLQTSRVYQRVRPRDSIWTPTSSQRGSMALSMFSDLTLGDLSAVSVYNLPVWRTDLSNAEHYRFGPTSLALPADRNQERQRSISRKPFPVKLEDKDTSSVIGAHAPFSRTRIRMYTVSRQKMLSGRHSGRLAEYRLIKRQEESEEEVMFQNRMREQIKARKNAEQPNRHALIPVESEELAMPEVEGLLKRAQECSATDKNNVPASEGSATTGLIASPTTAQEEPAHPAHNETATTVQDETHTTTRETSITITQKELPNPIQVELPSTAQAACIEVPPEYTNHAPSFDPKEYTVLSRGGATTWDFADACIGLVIGLLVELGAIDLVLPTLDVVIAYLSSRHIFPALTTRH